MRRQVRRNEGDLGIELDMSYSGVERTLIIPVAVGDTAADVNLKIQAALDRFEAEISEDVRRQQAEIINAILMESL